MGKIWFNGSMLFLWNLLFISTLPLILLGGRGGDDDGNDDLTVEQRSHINKEAIIETFEFDGEVIDCIDIYKQPALDHPLLKNHTIRMKPTSYPRIPKKWRAENKNVSTVEGVVKGPKPWILPRSCPKGSIPILRMGGLNASTSASTITHPPPAQRRIKDMLPGSSTTHEYAQITFTAERRLYGARAIINLQNPIVERIDEFSLAQIWVTTKDRMNRKTSLEAGWMVYPIMYGDHRTRLFTLWTNNNYQTFCYNHQCPGFVQTNGNINLGMPLEPTSTYGGPQHDIEFEIFQDRSTKDWWLKLRGAPLGYWPSHLVPQLRDGANSHAFGGEVFDKVVGRHTATQMGSGHFAGQGYRKSAYFRNVLVVDGGPPSHSWLRGIHNIATQPRCYDLDVARHPQLLWGNYFYYGGPGRSQSCQ